MPNIKLPDGKKIEFSKSITGLEKEKKNERKNINVNR